MKKRLIILMIFAAILMLTSCAQKVPTKIHVPTPQPSETAVPEQTAPSVLPQIEGISAEDIAYIARSNDSQNPDGPTDIYALDREISEILTMLQELHPLEPVAHEDDVPGGFTQYELHLFDGRTIVIGFHIETVLIDRTYYSYENPRTLPEQEVIIATEQHSYPMSVGTIPYLAFNGSDRELAIQLIPQLERMTESGWEKLEYSDIGFCGTPQPFPTARVSDSFDLCWFEGVSAGTYRLSVYYFDESEEHLISTIFTLE